MLVDLSTLKTVPYTSPIGRFFVLVERLYSDDVGSVRLLEGQDWAVLNFQKTGTVPLNPSDEFSTLFDEQVFTFLMATRKIYLGNRPL